MSNTLRAIPLGQPILVGHYSEKRHRNLLDRMNNKDKQAYEEFKKAKELNNKAENIVRTASYRKGTKEEQRQKYREAITPKLIKAKQEGKPFYLHEKDLMHKLKKKLNQLRKQEQEWHSLKKDIELKGAKKQELESTINQESQELKELFMQVKIKKYHNSRIIKINDSKALNRKMDR